MTTTQTNTVATAAQNKNACISSTDTRAADESRDPYACNMKRKRNYSAYTRVMTAYDRAYSAFRSACCLRCPMCKKEIGKHLPLTEFQKSHPRLQFCAPLDGSVGCSHLSSPLDGNGATSQFTGKHVMTPFCAFCFKFSDKDCEIVENHAKSHCLRNPDKNDFPTIEHLHRLISSQIDDAVREESDKPTKSMIAMFKRSTPYCETLDLLKKS
ncbi:hypothetical protein CYMTET_2604 [Cymbomonas tetramitiformis]|uniref:Uncharacterized protein n=2 Tax=Cymbomonas tetramitiformis TaxID=36881 RepID=A0AAE0H6R6_9CHLO|nr:hypothetical protein CYMTET_2604 [Cymbomonas tetramitiformis]